MRRICAEGRRKAEWIPELTVHFQTPSEEVPGGGRMDAWGGLAQHRAEVTHRIREGRESGPMNAFYHLTMVPCFLDSERGMIDSTGSG